VAALLAVAFVPAIAQTKPAKPAGKPAEAPQAKPDSAKDKDAKKTYAVGDLVDPATSFVDLTGKPRTLKEFAGKTVVLDFWSIDCPISKGYEMRLKKLFSDFEKKNVVFLAVDANESEVDKGADPCLRIKDYVKKESIPYTAVLVDVKNVVADRFGAKTTPHAFVIDEKGKLRYAGGVDDDPEFKAKDPGAVKSALRDAVEAVLAGKEPPLTTTTPHGCSIKRAKAS
jgi:thiol-disulfide isomerase/thioredoxin